MKSWSCHAANWSPAAPQFVAMKICDGNNDDKVGIKTTLGFQCKFVPSPDLNLESTNDRWFPSRKAGYAKGSPSHNVIKGAVRNGMMPILSSRVATEIDFRCDNIGCHLWRKSWHYDNYQFSVLWQTEHMFM